MAKKEVSFEAQKLRAEIAQRAKMIAQRGKVKRENELIPEISEEEQRRMDKEWEEEEREKIRADLKEEMQQIKDYSDMVQTKLLNNTMDKLGVDYASHIATEIKAVALMEATVKENGLPNYTYLEQITHITRRQLERIWRDKGKIVSQSPAFVRNRQKGLALESITMMEKLMESFKTSDLLKMKTVDKIRLFDSLAKKTEALLETNHKEGGGEQRFVLDVVVSGEVKHTSEGSIKKNHYDFISAEDIEFDEEK